MRKQLSKRLGMADIRHTISSFCEGKISSFQACEALQIGKTRLYQLRTDFLLAKGLGRASVWTPKSSGGHHKSPSLLFSKRFSLIITPMPLQPVKSWGFLVLDSIVLRSVIGLWNRALFLRLLNPGLPFIPDVGSAPMWVNYGSWMLPLKDGSFRIKHTSLFWTW